MADDSVSDVVCVSGDSLRYHGGWPFSTRDRDNDWWRDGNCAHYCKGDWWYFRCGYANLNGLSLGGANIAEHEGIIWKTWHGAKYSLKTVAMKIRPQSMKIIESTLS